MSSVVWQFFENKGGEAAKCNVCKATVKRKSNTTNLIVHLRKHDLQYKEYCRLKQSGGSGGVDDSSDLVNNNDSAHSSKKSKQTTLSMFTNPPLTASRNNDITQAVVNWLCEDGVPIYCVEKQGFKNLMAVVEKRYSVPSRKSVMSYVTSNYDTKCRELKLELEENIVKPKRFCSITTDLWSANTMDPYMAVTIHYINQEWELQSKLLQCAYLPGSHTGDLLAEELMNTMVEWGLAKSAYIGEFGKHCYVQGLKYRNRV